MKSLNSITQLLQLIFFLFENKEKQSMLLYNILMYLKDKRHIPQYAIILITMCTQFACNNGDRKMPHIKTNIECKDTTIKLGNIPISFKKDTVILLKNTGKEPLIIDKITSSCGCTIAYWDKEPISPQATTTIKASIQRFESGFFSKELFIHCNSEQSPIEIKISGTIIPQ